MSLNYEETDLGVSRLREEQHSKVFARATIWTIVAGLLGFVAWAATTPVYEVVTGTGQVRPTGLVQRAEHLEGGIVAQIHVDEGDRVEKGDPLVSLDQSAVASELMTARAEEQSLREQYARAEALFAGNLIPGDGLNVTYAAEGDFRQAQIAVLRAERDMTHAELTALTDQEEKLSVEIAILSGRQERFERLESRGLVVQNELENARRDLVRQESERARLTSERAVRAASIVQSRARETELLARFQRESALELESLKARLVAATQNIEQLQERMDRATVKAPIAGFVQALSVANPGQILETGAIVAEVVPAGVGLFADIEVSAARISGIVPGRHARLKILTHDFTRFGDIDAVVERVSPTSIVREDGQSVFRVRLSFDDNQLGEQRTVGSGMTVTADIRSDRRTVLEYLLKPVRVIADRALSES